MTEYLELTGYFMYNQDDSAKGILEGYKQPLNEM